MMLTLIMTGCKCLFAAPACTSWSAHTKGLAQPVLDERRSMEGDNLKFLALLCLVQTILGGMFVIENPAGSDIWKKTPLAMLEDVGMTIYDHSLHQCGYGAKIGNEFIKKPTVFERT